MGPYRACQEEDLRNLEIEFTFVRINYTYQFQNSPQGNSIYSNSTLATKS